MQRNSWKHDSFICKSLQTFLAFAIKALRSSEYLTSNPKRKHCVRRFYKNLYCRLSFELFRFELPYENKQRIEECWLLSHSTIGSYHFRKKHFVTQITFELWWFADRLSAIHCSSNYHRWSSFPTWKFTAESNPLYNSTIKHID